MYIVTKKFPPSEIIEDNIPDFKSHDVIRIITNKTDQYGRKSKIEEIYYVRADIELCQCKNCGSNIVLGPYLSIINSHIGVDAGSNPAIYEEPSKADSQSGKLIKEDAIWQENIEKIKKGADDANAELRKFYGEEYFKKGAFGHFYFKENYICPVCKKNCKYDDYERLRRKFTRINEMPQLVHISGYVDMHEVNKYYESYDFPSKNYSEFIKHLENELDKNDSFEKTFDKIKSQRRNYIIQNKAKPITDEYFAEVERNRKPVGITTPNKEVNVKEYLKQLVDLEQACFSLKKRIEDLIPQASIADVLSQQGINYKVAISTRKIKEDEKSTEEKINSYNFGLTLHDMPSEIEKPVAPDEPIYQKEGLFNKKKVREKNEHLKSLYEEEVSKYNEDLKKYDAYVEKCNKIEKENSETSEIIEQKRNEQLFLLKEKTKEKEDALIKQIKIDISNGKIFSPQIAEKTLIDSELKKAKAIYQELIDAREKKYAEGVLFGKYQNFATVTMLYEYLESGRCDSLTGPNGAYNLYEAELRQNIIISKMDTIINKLDQVKQNQYVLASKVGQALDELNTMNQTLTNACKTLDNIDMNSVDLKNGMKGLVHNTEVAAYASAEAAYYSKINAYLSAVK